MPALREGRRRDRGQAASARAAMRGASSRFLIRTERPLAADPARAARAARPREAEHLATWRPPWTAA